MRISDLQYLLKVVELQSISRAAEQMYITQQGLSRIISSLEKELDITLFLRRGNSIELTPIGQQVVEHARDIIQNYSAMLRDISQFQSPDQETSAYTIYATPVMCITLLPKIFLTLYQTFPMIKFNVIEALPPDIVDQAHLDGDAVGILSIADFLSKDAERLSDPGLCFNPVFRDRLMLNVRKDSPLTKHTAISRSLLAQTPIALHNTESSMLAHLLGGAASKVAVHTVNHELCRDMVNKGMAAGLTSDFLDFYLSSDLTTPIPLEHTVEIEYGCIYAASGENNPITRTIIDLVNQELRWCRERQNQK